MNGQWLQKNVPPPLLIWLRTGLQGSILGWRERARVCNILRSTKVFGLFVFLRQCSSRCMLCWKIIVICIERWPILNLFYFASTTTILISLMFSLFIGQFLSLICLYLRGQKFNSHNIESMMKLFIGRNTVMQMCEFSWVSEWMARETPISIFRQMRFQIFQSSAQRQYDIALITSKTSMNANFSSLT